MDPIVTLGQSVPGVETSAGVEAVKYGVVGVIALVFGYVIIYLYKENRTDRKEAAANEKGHAREMAELRKEHEKDIAICKEQCRNEKEVMRAEYEKRHREVLEGYTAQLSQVRSALDKREDDIRREFNAHIERLANANKESSEALVEMLQQFLNKVVK